MRRVFFRLILLQGMMLLLATNGLAGRVGTSDILDGAVTTPKLADGAVTDAKIAGGAVTADKVMDGSITALKLADGSVSATKIADGAVTAAKITGQIPASKISSVGLNADTLDGIHASSFSLNAHLHAQSDINGLQTVLNSKSDTGHTHINGPSSYAKVITVAKSGGDYSDPRDAMNSISDASENNRYLIKIMPGVYDLSSPDKLTRNEPITVRDFVDIEGSGVNVTKLYVYNQDNIGDTSGNSFFALYYSNIQNSEIRDLTIEAVAGNSVCNGFGHSMGGIGTQHSSPVLRNLKIIASGAGSNYGVSFGQTSNTSDPNDSNTKPRIIDCEIITNTPDLPCANYSQAVAIQGGVVRVSGSIISSFGGDFYSAGIFKDSGVSASLDVKGSVIYGDKMGLYVSGSSSGYLPDEITIFDSQVSGVTYSAHIANRPSNVSMKAASTLFNGAMNSNSNAKLVFCYDGNFEPLYNGIQ